MTEISLEIEKSEPPTENKGVPQPESGADLLILVYLYTLRPTRRWTYAVYTVECTPYMILAGKWGRRDSRLFTGRILANGGDWGKETASILNAWSREPLFEFLPLTQ